ncbi:MAG: ATP-binding protein [Candidatus Omnitrophota bacterium]|nr:ATP-binding protein [Candidatus Omnitrophota bacterium]
MKPRSLLAGVTLLAFLTTQGICPIPAFALRPSVEGVQSGLEEKLTGPEQSVEGSWQRTGVELRLVLQVLDRLFSQSAIEKTVQSRDRRKRSPEVEVLVELKSIQNSLQALHSLFENPLVQPIADRERIDELLQAAQGFIQNAWNDIYRLDEEFRYQFLDEISFLSSEQPIYQRMLLYGDGGGWKEVQEKLAQRGLTPPLATAAGVEEWSAKQIQQAKELRQSLAEEMQLQVISENSLLGYSRPISDSEIEGVLNRLPRSISVFLGLGYLRGMYTSKTFATVASNNAKLAELGTRRERFLSILALADVPDSIRAQYLRTRLKSLGLPFAKNPPTDEEVFSLLQTTDILTQVGWLLWGTLPEPMRARWRTLPLLEEPIRRLVLAPSGTDRFERSLFAHAFEWHMNPQSVLRMMDQPELSGETRQFFDDLLAWVEQQAQGLNPLPGTYLPAAGVEEPLPREFLTYQERLVNQVNAEGNFKVHLDQNGFVETLDLPTATALNTRFKLDYGGTKYLLLAEDSSRILLVETALKAFYVIDANDYRNLRSAGPKLTAGVFTEQIDPGPGMIDEGRGQEELRDLLVQIGAAGETAGFDVTPLVYSGDVEPDDLDTALRGVVTIKMPEGESSIRVVVSQGNWVVSKLPAAGVEEDVRGEGASFSVRTESSQDPEELFRIIGEFTVPPRARHDELHLLDPMQEQMTQRFSDRVRRERVPLRVIGEVADDALVVFRGQEIGLAIHLSEVLSNAIDAVADRSEAESGWNQGRVEITLRRQGDALILEVSDNGIGFTETDLRDNALRNGFTTKGGEARIGESGGALLDLYGRNLVEQLGGSLEIISRRAGEPESGRLLYQPSNEQEYSFSRADRSETGTAVRWSFPGVFSPTAAGVEEGELIAEETVAADAAELASGFRVAVQANLQPGLAGRFGEARLVTISNEPERAAQELKELAADESVAAILLDRMQFLDEKEVLRILPAEHGPAFLLFPVEAQLFTPAVAAALLRLQLPANGLFLLKLKQDELGTHLQVYA